MEEFERSHIPPEIQKKSGHNESTVLVLCWGKLVAVCLKGSGIDDMTCALSQGSICQNYGLKTFLFLVWFGFSDGSYYPYEHSCETHTSSLHL